MKKVSIVSALVVCGVLLGSAAFASDRVTGSATLVNPGTQAYVGTFIEDCAPVQTTHPPVSAAPLGKGPYVGVYLAQPFQVAGHAVLGISSKAAVAFAMTPRVAGEEGTLVEVGGSSRIGCLPIGSKVTLFYNAGSGASGSMVILGTGIIK